MPGLEKTYGIAPVDGKTYEPASGNIPQEDLWETTAYLDFAPKMMAHVREQFGYGVHVLHDVHHRLTPIEAGRLGASLEPFRPFWIEDPTPAEDQSAFRLIRQHTTTPIAVGEVFNSIWDCQQLITERLIDYIRTSVSHAGGITHLRRIFSLADLYGVRSGSHGAGDLSPVSFAAALHVDMSIPNFGVQEYMGHRDPPMRCSRPPTPSPTATCTPATPPASASSSTRRRPPSSRSTPSTCPSTAASTGRCMTGE